MAECTGVVRATSKAGLTAMLAARRAAGRRATAAAANGGAGLHRERRARIHRRQGAVRVVDIEKLKSASSSATLTPALSPGVRENSGHLTPKPLSQREREQVIQSFRGGRMRRSWRSRRTCKWWWHTKAWSAGDAIPWGALRTVRGRSRERMRSFGWPRVLAALERYQRDVVGTLAEHPLCGRPTLSVGTIRGG